MKDRIEHLGSSTIHHGRHNNRIFLLKLAVEECPGIFSRLDDLADKKGYTKIIAKVPENMRHLFVAQGFHREAYIPDFFNSRENDGQAVSFMGKYTDPARSREKDREAADMILISAVKKQNQKKSPPLPSSFTCRPMEKKERYQMAAVYSAVFQTYPFPIHDPDYIADTMDQGCLYGGIWHKQQLVSLACADMDTTEKNAEMTDFATLPHYRGRRFAGILLGLLESAVGFKSIKTAYTIARAGSSGINTTFSRAGYIYSGRLINNTNISGRIESMNTWYKPLPEDKT